MSQVLRFFCISLPDMQGLTSRLNAESQLIGVEGVKTPAGLARQGRPAGASATRRLAAPPAESETPGTEVNSPFIKKKRL